MEASLVFEDMELTGMAALDLRDKVSDLSGKLDTSVAVLTQQHGFLLEKFGNLQHLFEETAKTAATDRKDIANQIAMVSEAVQEVALAAKATDDRVSQVVEELKVVKDRTLMKRLKENAPAIGIVMTLLAFMTAIIKWLIVNYQPIVR